MKRLLVVLFLSLVFFLPSFARDEKDKNIPWYLSSPGHYSYSTYPPSLFDPNYLDKHNRWQEYFNSFIHKPRRGAIVVRKPLSFGESFLDGLGKGLEKGIDNFYRAREQKQDIEFKMGLIKLKWASEGYYPKSKYSQPQRYLVPERPPPSYESMIKRHIETYDKARHNLDFPKKGLLPKDLRTYEFPLNKYRLLSRITILESFLEGAGLWNKYKEFTNDVVGLMPEGGGLIDLKSAIDVAHDGFDFEWKATKLDKFPPPHKTIKLNKYLKSQGLSLVPINVDVRQVFDGDWVIYWDGEKWARKKKEVSHEDS